MDDMANLDGTEQTPSQGSCAIDYFLGLILTSSSQNLLFKVPALDSFALAQALR